MRSERSLLLIHDLTLDEKYELGQIDWLAAAVRSRWGMAVIIQSDAEYRAGAAAEHDHVLVVKKHVSDAAPALRRDLPLIARKSLVWLGERSDLPVSATLGPRVIGGPADSGLVDRVRYNGIDVVSRPITYDVQDGGVIGIEIRLGYHLQQPVDPTVARVLADALSDDGNSYPLAFELGSSENVLVSPLLGVPYWTQAGEAFAIVFDTFHTILGPAAGSLDGRSALVRLEDVNPFTYRRVDSLLRVFDALETRGAPFHIAYFPRYIDPAKGIDLSVTETRRFAYALRHAVDKQNGTLVQHGYTHQWGESVSGIGFEFWDELRNAPLAFESAAIFSGYIEAARLEAEAAGLPVPNIWETPHYVMSDLADTVISAQYRLRYERRIGTAGVLPFPIELDGNIYIPETLGYVGNPRDIDLIEKRIRLLATFHEPVTASFFWHPWRPLDEVVRLVEFAQGEGFTFVKAHDLAAESPPEWQRPSESGHYTQNAALFTTMTIFVLGFGAHVRKRNLLRRSIAKSRTFVPPTVEDLEREHGDALPMIAVFVPAREETRVIHNTITRLAQLDYPRDRLRVVVITDGRETPDPEVRATTRDVALGTAAQINARAGCPLITVVDVPDWYSGAYGSREWSHARSTKGRALNYALQWLDECPELQAVGFIGVVDADGRLSRTVLREVADQILTRDARLMQGPVLQISNFARATLVGRMAGLELADYHFTVVSEFGAKSRIPKFLAGTNYFIERQSLVEAGAWDQSALVEDAELAVRLYARQGLKLSWLNSPEVEQTAPNYAIFRRQRERWVRGHLNLIPSILRAPIPAGHKIALLWKIVASQFRFIFDLALMLFAAIVFFSGALGEFSPMLQVLGIGLLLGALLIMDNYGYTYRQLKTLDTSGHLTVPAARVSMLMALMFFPFAFRQMVPRVEALWNWSTSRSSGWYKTERSIEVPHADAPVGIPDHPSLAALPAPRALAGGPAPRSSDVL